MAWVLAAQSASTVGRRAVPALAIGGTIFLQLPPALWHEGLCPACLVVAPLDVRRPVVARGAGERVRCP